MNKINKTKIIISIILLSNLVLTTNVFSQNKYKRKISITEWLTEMESCNDSIYKLKDTEIFFDRSKDSLYGFWIPRTIEPTEKDKNSIKNILPAVILIDCKLPSGQVRNVIFQNNITFWRCEGAEQLIFYNCTFEQGLDMLGSDFGILEFMYSSLRQRMSTSELQSNNISFYKCSFYTDYKVVNSPHHFGFEEENHNAQFLFLILQNEKKIGVFQLASCKFSPTQVKPVIYFSGGKYDIISFSDINFSNSIINFDNCSVKETFSVEKCKFVQPIGMHKFNFPKNNTSFLWSQIDSVGLGLYSRNYFENVYTYKSDSLVSDIYDYNELNSSYRKFFSMYRTQGDMESANACYKQMKDMETKRYHYLYQQHPSTNKWFNWRFNQFLKHFSEYGTNPVQSLIVSMWTILFFAAIYFFFYSEWDGINRSFLINQHQKMMQYFRSEQRLEDFYTESYKEDLQTFAGYKKELEESKSKLPFFITLLGKPLYIHSIIKHKILTFLYRRTDILQGRWIDLKPKRKVFVGITVSLSIMVYIVYLVFIRAINSTTLSVNAFSTLGFGAIPVKGTSRYITILEGFLGWFLLSIFSVSLISQMLQN